MDPGCVDKRGGLCENSKKIARFFEPPPDVFSRERPFAKDRNEMPHVRLNVNGAAYPVDVTPSDTLATVLREKLGFTDVKASCEKGECGSCTVLVDGKSVVSCLFLA